MSASEKKSIEKLHNNGNFIKSKQNKKKTIIFGWNDKTD